MKTVAFCVLIYFGVNNATAQTRKIRIDDNLIYYTDKEFKQPLIMPVKPGDSITVTKYKDVYWSTIYKGDTVYIDEYDLNDIKAEKRALERKKQIADSIVKRRFLIKKYGLKMGAFISNGYIKIGMTRVQAKYSWGEPDEIHKTVGKWGVHEQWVYGSSYLYFENGILTAWQD